MSADHDDEHHEHDDHGHEHGHERGVVAAIKGIFAPHSHSVSDRIDEGAETAAGIRALKISLAALGATSAMQAVVVVISGSVALLGDTLHNLGDALTALPLWLAFRLGRRPPNRRYTHGYGRSEDVAGIFIVLVIAASGLLAGYESIRRLLDPQPVTHLPAVMAAAVLGFVGNELVAVYRIRVGRRIGSAALVADGLHARTDGLTSLAVLFGAIGVAFGWDAADPVVGLLITAAIAVVLRSAAKDIYLRLMDAVDPELVDQAEGAIRSVEGVRDVGEVRVRWIGHEMRAEVTIAVDAHRTVAEGHEISERATHALLHEVPRLTSALVHADPAPAGGADGAENPHAATEHHRAPSEK